MKFVIVLFLCLPACAQTWFSNLKTTPSSTSCAVSWTSAVPTVGHVNYGLAAGSYTNHTAGTTTYTTSNSAVLAGLKPGTTYHFKIISADTSKDWVSSLDYTCKTATTTTSTQHSVQLNWKASTSSSVTGYDVYRSTTAGGYYNLLGSPSNLSYTDKNVQSGTTYYYVVTAVNSSGLQSKYSNQVQATIP